ncbi:MAG: PEP-CTERM system histidine kinase PrsK [Roseibium album]|uniref:XrtA/PEP-CTERM system histidine kinase PrsK n=1 Tax=Roseibium album TaxID=311410 RepID=UPI0032EB42F5
MTLEGFYFISLLAGLVAYVGLTLFCIVTWIRKITGRAAFLASFLTLLFVLSLLLTGIGPVSFSLEVLTMIAWTTLLVRVLGITPRNARAQPIRSVTLVYGLGVALAALLIAYAWTISLGLAPGVLPVSGLFAGELLLAICGLIVLEQVVRNTRDDLRWRLRYLNIGIGTLLGFQLLHNACALLFNDYMPTLVAVQPGVLALVTPFIALASLRNPRNPLRVNLSRRFVFGSGVLMGSGALLLLMGLLGYLVRALDGDWGAALIALIAIAATVAGITVVGSTSVRSRTRRWLEEHLFSTKYDYREEWRRVTEQLTEPSPDYDLPQQVLRALGRVLQSHSGALWKSTDPGVLIPCGAWHASWDRPLGPTTSARLTAFFEAHEWVLDLENLPEAARPDIIDRADLSNLAGIRFLVPLMTESKLFGLAALAQPQIAVSLSWEDHTLLKLIGRQAAGFLALREADRELAAAAQLNSVSQTTAFIVHDIKTISAQLSLLLDNARKHGEDPAFVKDMILTVDHSVGKMRRLIDQLRKPDRRQADDVDLVAELRALQTTYRHQPVRPEFCLPETKIGVAADAAQLRSATGHLIQNSIDAAARNDRHDQGAVRVAVRSSDPWAEVTIQDNGPGMSREFIDEKLFHPFSSTKGVSGMGIGAYQARSYVRSIGGDVSIESTPGSGSTFTIRLPLKGAS